jgi:hypothetical protein
MSLSGPAFGRFLSEPGIARVGILRHDIVFHSLVNKHDSAIEMRALLDQRQHLIHLWPTTRGTLIHPCAATSTPFEDPASPTSSAAYDLLEANSYIRPRSASGRSILPPSGSSVRVRNFLCVSDHSPHRSSVDPLQLEHKHIV